MIKNKQWWAAPDDSKLKWNWQDKEFAVACDTLKFNRLRLTKDEEELIIKLAKKFI